jgi:hypothetical protein
MRRDTCAEGLRTIASRPPGLEIFLCRATQVDLKSGCKVGGYYGKRNDEPHCAIAFASVPCECKRAATFAHHGNEVCAQDADVDNVIAVHVPFSADEAVAEIDAT